jgi:hypothetical protein
VFICSLTAFQPHAPWFLFCGGIVGELICAGLMAWWFIQVQVHVRKEYLFAVCDCCAKHDCGTINEKGWEGR